MTSTAFSALEIAAVLSNWGPDEPQAQSAATRRIARIASVIFFIGFFPHF